MPSEEKPDSNELPQLREHTILPLGSITYGEFFQRMTEKFPDFAKIPKEEQFEIVNEAIAQAAKIHTALGGTDYQMDTGTFAALKAQQVKENSDKYIKLLKMAEEALSAIRNAPADLPQQEQVKLQQRSVDIQSQLGKFQEWFIKNKIPIPNSNVTIKPAIKGSLLDECRRVCEEMLLPKGETFTREMKYKIAQEIQMDRLPKFKAFKSGNRTYHRISKMLSELGYSAKPASKRRKN